ncbi:MAG: hypothetical protein LQ340_006057, partial [Diploschistes diacapsis]
MKRASQVANSSLGLPTNPPAYVYQVQALHDGDQLAALCSDDSVRGFRASALGSKPTWVLPTGHEGVTQLRMQVWDQRALVLTAGRDGAVRVWDRRAGAWAGGEAVVEMRE